MKFSGDSGKEEPNWNQGEYTEDDSIIWKNTDYEDSWFNKWFTPTGDVRKEL